MRYRVEVGMSSFLESWNGRGEGAGCEGVRGSRLAPGELEAE